MRRPAWGVLVSGRRCSAIGFASSVGGCAGVLDPQGPVGRSEKLILIDAFAIMLVIVVPVILATVAFAWWFRASNARARRRPDWSYSGRLELMVWSVPLMIVLFLGGVGWIGSHDLDPGKPIASALKPLDIEVVSLDWKWLFIYPDQHIASVNRLVVPAGVPIRFRLTSASVMNSFFAPQLGSQIYAMAGMTTRLNLQADKPGTYPGLSAQFSGAGFSDMRFEVVAVPAGQFNAWLAQAQAGGPVLDAAAYAQLLKPSQANAAMTYRQVAPRLFESILDLSAPGGGAMSMGAAAPAIARQGRG